jgi:hypothetical protein
MNTKELEQLKQVIRKWQDAAGTIRTVIKFEADPQSRAILIKSMCILQAHVDYILSLYPKLSSEKFCRNGTGPKVDIDAEKLFWTLRGKATRKSPERVKLKDKKGRPTKLFHKLKSLYSAVPSESDAPQILKIEIPAQEGIDESGERRLTVDSEARAEVLKKLNVQV